MVVFPLVPVTPIRVNCSEGLLKKFKDKIPKAPEASEVTT